MANCRTLPDDFENQLNCELETGSVVAVAFIDDSVEFSNIESAAEWSNLVYSTDILIHKEVRGSYSKPESQIITSPGKNDSRIVGRQHELGFRASSIKENTPYWNILNNSSNYKFAFVIGSEYDLLMYINQHVTIDAAADVQEGLDSEVDWLVSVKWPSLELPGTSDVPFGIFDPNVPINAVFPYTFPFILS